MSNEDLRTLQRETLSAIQQLRTQSSSAAALQMQATLAGQLLRANEGSVGNLSSVVGEQSLVFSLADCEFAVKAELVQGVERLVDVTPVPNVMPWVKGVINLRGSIVSVVDLRMFLDVDSLPPTPRTRLLSLQYNEMVICFVVDGVSEMLPIPDTAIIDGTVRQAAIPSWVLPYASRYALVNNRVIVLLDVARLLFSEKMQRYEALG